MYIAWVIEVMDSMYIARVIDLRRWNVFETAYSKFKNFLDELFSKRDYKENQDK